MLLAWLEQLHWGAVLQIVLIDILLGGDNAVVIALACRRLEPGRRVQGILWGTAGAIAVRICLIAFALALLTVPYLKITGAVLLLWIGIRLMQPDGQVHGLATGATSVWAAVRTIVVADFVMSLDNVVAIAAAAQNIIADHQVLYVAFGLLLSVPIIVWGSTLVLRLLDCFPLLITFGAGLLGWIAGGMLVTDVALDPWLSRTDALLTMIIQAACAALVATTGLWWARRSAAQAQEQE